MSDGKNKYSVPYNLIDEKVDIRVTKTTVEVFYHGSRVASHRRLQTIQREPLVKLEHMPLAHQKYLTYNAGDFSRWAMSVGPMTEKVVQHFLTSGTAPEQSYKACAGLTKLGERYGRERLEKACGRILAYKDLKALVADLKAVYAAVDESTALDTFAEHWDKKYPKISSSLRDNWPNLSTYFKYLQEIRRLIYTTNAIEGFIANIG